MPLMLPPVKGKMAASAGGGAFDSVLAEARGSALPRSEIRYLRRLKA